MALPSQYSADQGDNRNDHVEPDFEQVEAVCCFFPEVDCEGKQGSQEGNDAGDIIALASADCTGEADDRDDHDEPDFEQVQAIHWSNPFN